MTVVNTFLVLLKQKEAKEGHRITYADVKAATGIAESTLSAWANNTIQRFDRDTIEALCAYFDCKPGDLLVLEKDSSPAKQS